MSFVLVTLYLPSVNSAWPPSWTPVPSQAAVWRVMSSKMNTKISLTDPPAIAPQPATHFKRHEWVSNSCWKQTNHRKLIRPNQVYTQLLTYSRQAHGTRVWPRAITFLCKENARTHCARKNKAGLNNRNEDQPLGLLEQHRGDTISLGMHSLFKSMIRVPDHALHGCAIRAIVKHGSKWF